ncbi:hypothetical protein AB0M11_26470 [Streptomyces sp. NPDC051987]|uniref:hypothetical protein n=1 Tax=Streptomyces sp. NPDC051987 TaxID=3155808 RepID=UPI003426B5E1
MSDRMIEVHGRCPACGNSTLFLGDGGHITCSLVDCPRPDLVNEVIGEIGDARQHAAYTFCSQLVGHVTMAAFARKSTEKITAVAHRAEAVAYANEQKKRADTAEGTLQEVLDAFEAYWSRSSYDGPGMSAVQPEHFQGWRALLDQPAPGPATVRPGLRERHHAQWAALTDTERAARLAELDQYDEPTPGPAITQHPDVLRERAETDMHTLAEEHEEQSSA